MDTDKKKKGKNVGQNLRAGDDQQTSADRITEEPSKIAGIMTGTCRRENGDINLRNFREDQRTERRLLFDETDDIPKSATETTYDLKKAADDIIDRLEEEPLRKSTRRESGK